MNQVRGLLIGLILLAIALPVSAINLEERARKLNRGEYKSDGPLGMPAYKFPLTVEFLGGPVDLAPEAQACVWLNQIHSLSAPGDPFRPSPEDQKHRHCTLVKLVKAPKGKLESSLKTSEWAGTSYPIYQYKPVRVGKDRMRFVLAYGQQNIDCTAVIDVVPYEH